MTAKEMITVVGKTGTYTTKPGFYVNVEIVDVRKVFNRVDYLIVPKSGSGNLWVSAEMVTAIEP